MNSYLLTIQPQIDTDYTDCFLPFIINEPFKCGAFTKFMSNPTSARPAFNKLINQTNPLYFCLSVCVCVNLWLNNYS